MDRQTLALLVPIMALAIPVAAIIMRGLTRSAQLRLEELRIRQGGALDGQAGAAIAELQAEVEALRGELGELHERLDFTERLLAQRAEQKPLP